MDKVCNICKQYVWVPVGDSIVACCRDIHIFKSEIPTYEKEKNK